MHGRENACGAPDCYRNGPELRYQRAGGQATLGVRGSAYERFTLGYRYEGIHAELTQPGAAYVGPPIRLGDSHLSGLALGFDRDARDDTFLPRHGSRIQLAINVSSRV